LEDPTLAITNLKKIIEADRYDLLMELINEDLIHMLNEISIEDMSIVNKKELIKYLKSINTKVKAKEEYQAA